MLTFFSVFFTVIPNWRTYILVRLKINKTEKRLIENKGGICEKCMFLIAACVLGQSFNNSAFWLWIYNRIS